MVRNVDVAVVGGGASGTLSAAWLLRLSRGRLKVALIERRPRLGGGVAYGTRRPEHLLNVPAGRMSADPADPQQFLRWARRRVRDAAPGSFLQRRLYGDYLRWFLDRSKAGSRAQLHRVRGEAVEIAPAPAGDGYRVRLRGGQQISARWVVLATGNSIPEPLRGAAPELEERGLLVSDPWGPKLSQVQPSATVIIAGSGLTAVDAVATLCARGHRGRILLVSRHGLLPRPHVVAAPASEEAPPKERTLRELVQWLRRSGDAWRSALDVLRPASAAVWRGLSQEEQTRFLRHARTFWDVFRHRMPPSLDELTRSLQQSGRLVIVAGRVLGAAPNGPRVRVRVRHRGGSLVSGLDADVLVNCTGPALATTSPTPLTRRLLEAGLASADPLGLGLRTRGGALVDASGRVRPRLLAVGPLRRAELWETTAIPEIREQAKQVAERILGRAAGAERGRSGVEQGRVLSARS